MPSLATTNQEASLSSSASSRLLAVLIAACVVPSVQGQDKLRGMEFEDTRYNKLPLSINYGKILELPAKASLKQFTPRVVNQSTSNTSVVWATAWYGYTILQASQQNVDADSIGTLPLSPGFVYRKIQSAEGCSRPVSLIDALEELSSVGAPRFSDLRGFCVEADVLATVDTTQSHKLGGYVRLFNTYDPGELKINAVKQVLALGSPVVLGMICPPSFSMAKDFWQPREPKALLEHGGHALTIIGFDDALYGGAFEVVNSWSRGWGKEGFSWIRYDDFPNYALYGFRLLSGEVSLRGAIDFFSGDGKFMSLTGDGKGSYRFDRDYKTGESFLIHIETAAPAFMHMTATDAAGNSSVLFPNQRGTVPLIDGELKLPATGSYPLTEPAGKNTITIILARSQSALDKVVSELDSTSSGVALSSGSMWQPSRIQFKSQSEYVVMKVLMNQL
jgi:hypothetical protein